LGYAASPAGAQTATGGGATGGPTDNGQIVLNQNQNVTISLEQQVSAVQGYLSYAARIRESIQKQLQAARQARDVVKVLCLNDKLNQVDVTYRSLSERQKLHSSAVQRTDRESANHEFTIISVMRKTVEQKMTEANQCIGQESAYTGTTTTFTTIDPNLPPPGEEPPGLGLGDNPLPPTEIGPPEGTPPPPPCSPLK
jgi:hypothetical protein